MAQTFLCFLKVVLPTGPSTPARDKGKGLAISPQQQALRASLAAMQRDGLNDGSRYIPQNMYRICTECHVQHCRLVL